MRQIPGKTDNNISQINRLSIKTLPFKVPLANRIPPAAPPDIRGFAGFKGAACLVVVARRW